MTAGGDTSIPSARRVAVQTRKTKDYDVDPATLAIDWHHRAEQHGVDTTTVQQVVNVERATQQMSAQHHCADRIVLGEDSLANVLTASDATFDRRAVLRALAEHTPAGATVPELERRAEQFLASGQVEAVGVALTGVQYSTVELLAIETRLLDTAIARQHEGVGLSDATAVEGADGLSDQQAAMVTKLTTDGAGVSVVIGAAGPAKPTHSGSPAKRGNRTAIP